MGKLFFLFAIMPIIEIAVLIEVGDRIGGWPTIGLVILTAAVGAALVRMQGVATLFQARRKMDMGQIPGQEMAEGLMLAIAGVLLVTPGFVTDAFGLLLVAPFSRPLIARWLLNKMQVQVVQAQQQQQYYRRPNQDDDNSTIEGEYKVKPDQQKERDKLPKD
ncbi:FxsA family protein [Lacimicrobium alkaliphilum]|uniref:Membrane protein FxsA n=1 Tax=Lacimicrobium alkaliphilum TaxID=1526571 RepID=A0ABQ1RJ92_9ALTE|nr:FxsA family protein [Lacimicrobium alkaliphilum]GGD70106.1 membrane protein FxsA [Lacimicrobium alkaliphilum]